MSETATPTKNTVIAYSWRAENGQGKTCSGSEYDLFSSQEKVIEAWLNVLAGDPEQQDQLSLVITTHLCGGMPESIARFQETGHSENGLLWPITVLAQEKVLPELVANAAAQSWDTVTSGLYATPIEELA